ncbi:copper resistance CopC family protein [Actinocorallia sp. B10E7]|uniref:copper resistance CopC family protein n=1 Tax=Actinocorallia sp. B10E7 TaxID=3153558 RepID=UPI00325C664C
MRRLRRLLLGLRRLLKLLRGRLLLRLRLRLLTPRQGRAGAVRPEGSIRWKGLQPRTEKTMTSPARRIGPLTALATLLLLLLAAPARAHTALTGSTPADGAEIAAPSQVTLTFNEALRSAKVVIRPEKSEAEVQKGAADLDGEKVVQKIKGTLPAGKYTVGYRVISADGHPVTGVLSFTVTGEGGTGPAAEDPGTGQGAQSAEDAPAEGGATRWIMVGAGLAAGAGIGLMFTMRRRR